MRVRMKHYSTINNIVRASITIDSFRFSLNYFHLLIPLTIRAFALAVINRLYVCIHTLF